MAWVVGQSTGFQDLSFECWYRFRQFDVYFESGQRLSDYQRTDRHHGGHKLCQLRDKATDSSRLLYSISSRSYLSFFCSFAPAHMRTQSCLESWTGTKMGTGLCLDGWHPSTHLLSSFLGIFWKCARIGERLSPYISICCIFMAVSSTSARSGEHC